MLTKWWNPIALSMGFLPAEEMSARPMTTVFHHFSRHAGALHALASSMVHPSERLHQPFATTSATAAGAFVQTQK